MKNTNKRKVLNIIEIVIGSLFLLGFIGCIILQLTIPENAFTLWIKANVWDITKTVEGLKNQLPEIIQCLIYIILIILFYIVFDR